MVYWIREVLELVNVPDRYIEATQTAFTLIAVLIPLPILIGFYRWARPRQSLVPPYKERVLILGATSGVGKEIALAYAHRGCRNIALVGRRQKELDQAVIECIERKKLGEEWEMSQEAPGWEEQPGQASENRAKGGILALQGDCTNAEDLIRIREDCRGSEYEQFYLYQPYFESIIIFCSVWRDRHDTHLLWSLCFETSSRYSRY